MASPRCADDAADHSWAIETRYTVWAHIHSARFADGFSIQ